MNTQLAYQDLRDTTKRLFFIVGTSRSGSTLLQSMLNSHSEIVIPPETHFFKTFTHLKQRYREHNKFGFRNSLIDFWYYNKTRMRDLGLKKEHVLNTAQQLELYSPLDLFILQMTIYRKQRGKKIIGEKTPRHILYVNQIIEAFPEAKIISLFRDPRAAAYSEIKAHFGSPSVTVTTRRWHKYVEMHKRLEERLSIDQYLMLRYQDLVENPRVILKKVADFLGILFEEEMLTYYNREEKGFVEGEESWKAETLKPLQKDKNEEWKTGLTYWQVALVEYWAGINLKDLGYQSQDASLSLAKKLFYQCLDIGRSAWATITNARYEGYISPKKFKF